MPEQRHTSRAEGKIKEHKLFGAVRFHEPVQGTRLCGGLVEICTWLASQRSRATAKVFGLPWQAGRKQIA